MIVPNYKENFLISRYFKYHHLLEDESGISMSRRGGKIAYNLQNNSDLSSLLGYNLINKTYNFIHKNKYYFNWEITEVSNKKCLLCGKSINPNKRYVQCYNCNNGCYTHPIGFYDYLYSKNEELNRTDKIETNTFDSEFFTIKAKFNYTEVVNKTCTYIATHRSLNKSIYDIKLKSLIFKPNIIINNKVINSFENIQYPENVNVKKSHLAILGWKKINWRR